MKYSEYYRQLDMNSKKRYNEKLDSLGTQLDDPYTFDPRPGMYGPADVPDIEYPDTLLVHLPRRSTKVWKLEGYIQILACGLGR